jgi:hypothetical protein
MMIWVAIAALPVLAPDRSNVANATSQRKFRLDHLHRKAEQDSFRRISPAVAHTRRTAELLLLRRELNELTSRMPSLEGTWSGGLKAPDCACSMRTKIVNATPKIPRGAIIGRQTGAPPLSEAEQMSNADCAVDIPTSSI